MTSCHQSNFEKWHKATIFWKKNRLFKNAKITLIRLNVAFVSRNSLFTWLSLSFQVENTAEDKPYRNTKMSQQSCYILPLSTTVSTYAQYINTNVLLSFCLKWIALVFSIKLFRRIIRYLDLLKRHHIVWSGLDEEP